MSTVWSCCWRPYREGQPRAVGRAISLIENSAVELPTIMKKLAPAAGRAMVVGITGAPGVGKSTTIAALVAAIRRDGRRVGVLAVDPSSPFFRWGIAWRSSADAAACA